VVIDTSAIVAILFDEADQRLYGAAIDQSPVRVISAVTRVELSFIIEGRKGHAGRARLDRFFTLTGTEIIPVTATHAEIAIDAFRRFGKGRHRAALNIGDCFACALAVASGRPLLFKGGGFGQTDVWSALPA